MKNIKFILIWIVLITSFLFFAVILILEANGLYFNPKSFKIQRTSLIILNGTPKNVDIYINSKKKTETFPIRFNKLFPGYYDIKVKKQGYQEWNKTFGLNPGQAIEQDEIILFLSKPIIVKLTDNKISLEKIKEKYTLQSDGLTIKNNNELWLDDKFITRFSNSIGAAILMKDENHIVFQIGTEIRVMEIDGTNNIKLLDLSKSDNTYFYISGDKLIFVNNNDLFETKVR